VSEILADEVEYNARSAASRGLAPAGAGGQEQVSKRGPHADGLAAVTALEAASGTEVRPRRLRTGAIEDTLAEADAELADAQDVEQQMEQQGEMSTKFANPARPTGLELNAPTPEQLAAEDWRQPLPALGAAKAQRGRTFEATPPRAPNLEDE